MEDKTKEWRDGERDRKSVCESESVCLREKCVERERERERERRMEIMR